MQLISPRADGAWLLCVPVNIHALHQYIPDSCTHLPQGAKAKLLFLIILMYFPRTIKACISETDATAVTYPAAENATLQCVK